MASILQTKTRSWAEVEQMLASGNVQGKLSKEDLPTPALCVDLDALEGNIAKMAAYARAQGRALRPHGKSHKCSAIARLTLAAGAVGACSAKLSEAEAFAAGGIESVLVTTPMVGRHRVERAVALATRLPGLILVVDHAGNADDLNAAAATAGVTLHVAIDLNVTNRTGIAPGPEAIALAEHLTRLPHLSFQGIQAYAGHTAHVVGFAERTTASQQAMAPAIATRRALEARGIPCPWLSGASTGTYNIDGAMDGVTELQPGSYLFMDLDYNRIGGQSGPVYDDFANSLTVLSTVYSMPGREQAILDAGLKAFATDTPYPPLVRGLPGAVYSFAGDEHARLDVRRATLPVTLGDRLELVIPHCDPTVNLYNRFFATRGEQVEALWRIDARGMST
ncbi:MAG: DSD1 family PLP-dependent enzyme [Acidobacteriota bacterium]